MSEQMREQLALYALGGLAADEAREVEAYLADNPAAQRELRELQWAADALLETAVSLPPSPQLETALMARIEADARHRFPRRQAAPARPAASGAAWLAALRRWLSGPATAGVAVALAAIMLMWALNLNRQLARSESQLQAQTTRLGDLEAELAGATAANAGLQEQVGGLLGEQAAMAQQLQAAQGASDELAAQLAAQTAELLAANDAYQALLADNLALQQDAALQQDVMALLTSSTVSQIALPGTEAQPAAQGRLLFSPDSQLALLLVDDMPPLPGGEVYQVLLIRDDGHDTAETFAVNFSGQNAVLVHAQAPLETFTAVGVSVEPEGGSPQRTGEIVLLGQLLGS